MDEDLVNFKITEDKGGYDFLNNYESSGECFEKLPSIEYH